MSLKSGWLFAALLSTAAVAQPVSIGIKGGVPLTDAFETLRGNTSSYATNTKRYVVGPAVQINLPLRFAIEVDALYKRLGYQYEQFSPALPVSAKTVANSWEFPITLKYAFLPGPVRPYAEAGAAFRNISGIREVRTTLVGAGNAINTTVNTSPEFNKRTDTGFVFGGGIEFKVSRLRISPGVRYTRWGSENFRDPINSLLRTNRNQADFLIGILF
jgi:opacity protein-like surface antigen